ncbi:hypothetical protein ILP97_06050 [Amycolatopsis sp. H6(2020)]|nr:hypothetical protein [Amycolatopsis sp. H6(2020)]
MRERRPGEVTGQTSVHPEVRGQYERITRVAATRLLVYLKISPLRQRHNTDTYRGHTLACLVAADRYHHLEQEMRQQLAAGSIVVCDRYVASSCVLQCMDGVPLPFVEAINAAADVPDLAVTLQAPPEVTAARVAGVRAVRAGRGTAREVVVSRARRRHLRCFTGRGRYLPRGPNRRAGRGSRRRSGHGVACLRARRSGRARRFSTRHP